MTLQPDTPHGARIAMVAGEPSGDLLGASLLKGLRNLAGLPASARAPDSPDGSRALGVPQKPDLLAPRGSAPRQRVPDAPGARDAVAQVRGNEGMADVTGAVTRATGAPGTANAPDMPTNTPNLAYRHGQRARDFLSTDTPNPPYCYGIGGPRMQAEGFAARWPLEKLTVRGYVEALRHVPEILRIRGAFRRELLAAPPAAFVGIDAPDFNFGLERALRHAGIPTVHFVCPSIWAWRGGRIKTIAQAVDHMLCVFPFETALLAKAGVAASYVGHPLADDIPFEPDAPGARRALGLPDGAPVIAVLPGSRRSEVSLIGPTFFAAMALMQQREPGLRFVMPAATPALRAQLDALAAQHPDLALTLVDGQSQTAMTAADAILVKSGTVTLEAALLKKPMVISYKVPWLTGQIMRRQGYLPYVGLPNILAGRFVVPELLQHFATPQALADATLNQLHDDANRRTLADVFAQMHHTLKQNTSQRAAQIVAQIVDDGVARDRRRA